MTTPIHRTGQLTTIASALVLNLAATVPFATAAAPTPHHVEGELLVKFQGGPRGAAAEHARNQMKHEVKRNFEFIGWQHVRLARGLSVETALADYRKLPGVLAAEPNLVGFFIAPISNPETIAAAAVAPGNIPNDPMFSQQYALARIGATNAWNYSTGSTNVVVAVIDTGIDYTHPDLAANMWRNPGEIPGNGIDDDGNGYVDDVFGINAFSGDGDPMDVGLSFSGAPPFYHGTACAGVLGAVGNNGTGVAGVNWRVGIMAIGFLEPGLIYGSSPVEMLLISRAIQAFEYVILMKRRGVNVVATSNTYGFAQYSEAFKEALGTAGAEGIVNVFAAGNNAIDNDTLTIYPSGMNVPGILMVAATDSADALTSFTTWGRSSVHLAAPGAGILSPTRGSGYVTWGGTSASCPHVAGAVALLAAAAPGASSDELRAAILSSTDPLPQPAQAARVLTRGRLNVGRAMQQLTNASAAPIIVSATPANARTRISETVLLRFSKPMQRASVESAFVLSPTVPGQFVWSDGDRALEFVPDSVWTPTNYTGRVLGMATDAAGFTLDGNYNRVAQSSPADDFVWSFSFPMPNDDFLAAQEIGGSSGQVAGTTRGASSELGEPDHAGDIRSSSSVWYRWNAPADGWVTFEVTQVGYDTLLAAYTGTNVQHLAELASNDNDGARQASRISFPVTAGISYAVVVSGKTEANAGTKAFINESLVGPFNLRWNPAPPPTITTFSPLTAYAGQTVTLSGTNFTGATRVLFNGASATFTNALTNNADLRITAVIPDNATTGPITIETPHGNVTTTSNFTVLSIPRLAIRPLSSNLVEVSWPTIGGFTFQRADSLAPTSAWTAASFVSARLTNGIRFVTVTNGVPSRFFRLYKP